MPYAELLNGIDEIAEKLTTAEYQNLMELLQKSQEQEPEQEKYYRLVYEKITIVPFAFIDQTENELICETKETLERDNTVYGKITDNEEQVPLSDHIHNAITEGELTKENLQIIKESFINKSFIKKYNDTTIIYRVKSLLKM